ncbi:MAG TPA: phenylalanine--tRNA ligase subunit beta, partial [Puia sp.]|nr:phenylalanine--tRNA ligase subunit beta [Puia sp.]
MTISYNWLCEYLPVNIDPEQLSRILTSVGLEVEGLEEYESIKGSLKGLIVGQVLTCEKHPNADKLKLTTVNVGEEKPLAIVCGAPNVAVGQKVIVAKPGVTIFPISHDPITLQVAKIRGIESYGMICAEDEIGMSENHAGILILPENIETGSAVADFFKPYKDYVFEIGLTPNHMDAMSHIGVARDVCSYLSHHEKVELTPKYPYADNVAIDGNSIPISVSIENEIACQRYSGLSINDIIIKESPKWMQDRLNAVGVRPINNIVDITNFVLHETGQPLHAFDADELHGKKIMVKNLPQGTPFTTLDGKKRILSSEDLMICDADGPICIAGVFGGLASGIGPATKNIFLESAYFNPADIRKSAVRHGLRTDAASRFEKGIDISNTVHVLQRAASLIKEIAGGEIASDIVDVYPHPREKQRIILTYSYLKKLSGKNYHPESVKQILLSLGFDITGDATDELHILAPYHKPDITLPADIVEEIMRIDGLDNIEIPATISISPSTEPNAGKASYKEKISNYLSAVGFNEILTNSITNSAYFEEAELADAVKMINNLSAELNIMRPSMLETGLESIAYNLNRKHNDLCFYEFGKTYNTPGVGRYAEDEHLCLFITGAMTANSWKSKSMKADIYYLKGVCEKIFMLSKVQTPEFVITENNKFTHQLSCKINRQTVLQIGAVTQKVLQSFHIKQPVFYADFHWDLLAALSEKNKIEFNELPKQLPVHRDLAIVVDASLPYADAEKLIRNLHLNKLQDVQLFDIFESEKLGLGKKSLALSFNFVDKEKTMTDQEVEEMMNKIMLTLE